MGYSLLQLAQDFYRFIEAANAPRTVQYYRRFLDDFLKHVGDVPVEQLKPLQLITWGRTWHHVQAVQRLLNWACDVAELIPRNPLRKVRKPAPGRRRRTLQAGQLVRLLRSADRRFRAFLLAMRETIARPQEIRLMRWEFLVPEDGRQQLLAALELGGVVCVLDEFKGRARRTDPDAPRLIPLSRRLCRLLLRLARGRRELSGPVFVNAQGRAWTANAVRLRMRRLRRRVGLGADHRGEQIVAYTLRHTGATRAVAQGVRDRVLAELMGHTSTRTTARYQHLDAGHLRAAMERLSPDRSKGRKNDERTQ